MSDGSPKRSKDAEKGRSSKSTSPRAQNTAPASARPGSTAGVQGAPSRPQNPSGNRDGSPKSSEGAVKKGESPRASKGESRKEGSHRASKGAGSSIEQDQRRAKLIAEKELHKKNFSKACLQFQELELAYALSLSSITSNKVGMARREAFNREVLDMDPDIIKCQDKIDECDREIRKIDDLGGVARPGAPSGGTDGSQDSGAGPSDPGPSSGAGPSDPGSSSGQTKGASRKKKKKKSTTT